MGTHAPGDPHALLRAIDRTMETAATLAIAYILTGVTATGYDFAAPALHR